MVPSGVPTELESVAVAWRDQCRLTPSNPSFFTPVVSVAKRGASGVDALGCFFLHPLFYLLTQVFGIIVGHCEVDIVHEPGSALLIPKRVFMVGQSYYFSHAHCKLW